MPPRSSSHRRRHSEEAFEKVSHEPLAMWGKGRAWAQGQGKGKCWGKVA